MKNTEVKWDKYLWSEVYDWDFEKHKYSVSVFKALLKFFAAVNKRVGIYSSARIIFKSLFYDPIFSQLKWQPGLFQLNNQTQEKHFKKTFNQFRLFIVIFNHLKKILGEETADRFIAGQMAPFILAAMKGNFHPVQEIDTVEVWLKQAISYLGDEIKKDRGIEGELYIASDKKSMKFHVTKCANVQILRAYGLKYTAAIICMCDHVTYHTVFPNLIFKRTNCLGVGSDYCDHVFKLRTKDDPVIDEENYGDCYKARGIREMVWKLEEEAKVLHFGSKDKWDEYAKEYFGKGSSKKL